jgi:hypothetical protein
MHGVASEWEGELGNHHSADVGEHGPNFAIGWLNLPKDMRTFDILGMGPEVPMLKRVAMLKRVEKQKKTPMRIQHPGNVSWSVSFVN